MTVPCGERAATHCWEAALLVAFVCHTLAVALLVPPWRHYDEPASLEYALLIRDLGRLPAYDEYVPELRAAIARSMMTTALFADLAEKQPGADHASVLGFNQRVHPPSYYALVAIATLPARGLPIESQLRIARLTSVLLAALCFYLAIRATRLLVADADVRVLVLTMAACLPPFADIMGAVNSDALANSVAVALLWAAARLEQPGGRWGRSVVLLALVGLAVGVKRALLAPAALLVAWLALRRLGLGWRSGAGICGALLGLAALGLTVLPGRLADWQAVPPGAQVLVREPALAYAGGAAFALSRPDQGPGPMAVQEIDPALRGQAAGHTVTLSALMRASRPGLLVLAPSIQIDKQLVADSVVVGDQWAPVSVSAYVPSDTPYLAVRLSGPFVPGTVFIDELTLVIDSAPAGPANDGLIGSELRERTDARNLLRNPGGERMLPDLAAVAPEPLRALLERPTVARALSTALAPEWGQRAYPRQLSELFQGFWGVLSWGELRAPAGWLLALSLVVLAGGIGALRLCVRIARGGHPMPLASARAWWLCVSLTLSVWALATLRVHLQPVPGVLIWSFGRYTYPALVPALVILCAGLYSVWPAALRRQGAVAIGIFIGVFTLVTFAGTLVAPG